jgi:hypothetical protein
MHVPTTAATPTLTGADGKPLTWVSATPHSTGKPGDPTNITVAVGTTNYPEDQGYPPPFTHPLSPNFLPLLRAVEDTWELYANIKFIDVPDAPSIGQSADIRVGIASLVDPTKIGTVTTGATTSKYNTTDDKLAPDTLVRIEDSVNTPVTRLPNGDYQYNNNSDTVFQDLLHELGHALGLAHNLNDPNSVMYQIGSSKNLVPDAQDIAGIQAIYGAPKPHSVVLAASEITTLKGLGVPPASFA